MTARPVWIDALIRDQSALASFVDALERIKQEANIEMHDGVTEGNLQKAAIAVGREECARDLERRIRSIQREEVEHAEFLEKAKGRR